MSTSVPRSSPPRPAHCGSRRTSRDGHFSNAPPSTLSSVVQSRLPHHAVPSGNCFGRRSCLTWPRDSDGLCCCKSCSCNEDKASAVIGGKCLKSQGRGGGNSDSAAATGVEESAAAHVDPAASGSGWAATTALQRSISAAASG